MGRAWPLHSRPTLCPSTRPLTHLPSGADMTNPWWHTAHPPSSHHPAQLRVGIRVQATCPLGQVPLVTSHACGALRWGSGRGFHRREIAPVCELVVWVNRNGLDAFTGNTFLPRLGEYTVNPSLPRSTVGESASLERGLPSPAPATTKLASGFQRARPLSLNASPAGSHVQESVLLSGAAPLPVTHDPLYRGQSREHRAVVHPRCCLHSPCAVSGTAGLPCKRSSPAEQGRGRAHVRPSRS